MFLYNFVSYYMTPTPPYAPPLHPRLSHFVKAEINKHIDEMIQPITSVDDDSSSEEIKKEEIPIVASISLPQKYSGIRAYRKNT